VKSPVCRRRIARTAAALSLPALGLVIAQIVLAAPPSASFTISDTTPDVNQTITFDAASSSDPDGDIASYEWDFDYDGTFNADTTSASPSTTHSYPSPGPRAVALRITDTDAVDGQVDVTPPLVRSLNVGLPNQAPTAAIACSPALVNPNATVTCSSAGSIDPDGSIAEYEWSVDSGAFIDGGASLTTSFATPGAHTIRLRVRDNTGALSAVASDSVSVNAPPSAVIQRGADPPQNLPAGTTVDGSINQNAPLVGQVVRLDSSGSSDPDGSIASRAWDVDDDGFDDGTAPTLELPFATAGPKTVRLQVVDNTGATTTASVSFRVNSLPTPGFITDNLTPVIDQTVAFSSTSSDPDNDISGYAWDFDDDGQFGEAAQAAGITCQSPQSAHASCQFADAGSYRVSLRVTDAGGISRVTSRQILIQSTVPNAAFAFAPDAPLPGQAVTFASTSTPSAGKVLTGYEWDFNYDGASFSPDATGQTVTHSFTSTGAKTVALRVSERMPGGGPATGGFGIVARTVTVNAPPIAALRISPPNPFVGEAATITSTARDPDGPIASQSWDLDGDGQFDDGTGPVVSMAYPTAGARGIHLRVTDSRGAVATASGVIDVRLRPLVELPRVVIGIEASVRGRFTRLRRLRVKAPVGAMVTVKCRPKGCPKLPARRGTGRVVRFKALERRLRAGVKVIITVTKPGFIGKQTTYTMRRGRGPKRVDLCVVPGAGRATSCPS
jgi:PKD repeat protein